MYINQLKDLTPKSADIESVFILRDIKTKTPLPLTYEKIFDYFALFFVSQSEKNMMEAALEQIEPTATAIKRLASLNDVDFELINLKRAVDMLNDIPEPLTLNINYAKAISLWQEEFTQEFAPLMNSIPTIQTQEEGHKVNNELNAIMQRILRNDQMAFKFHDIVNEAQKNRINDLYESMEKGFFFRVYLEEELRKISFEERKHRIPENKLKAVDEVKYRIKEIKKGVDAAYEVNLRMVNWGLVVYSYIKLMNQQR